MVAIYLSCGLIYYLLFCPTVTCLGRPIQSWARFNLQDALIPWLLQKSSTIRAMIAFFAIIAGLWRALDFFFFVLHFFYFAMSTLGTSYYIESPVLPEQDEIAPRYSSAAGVEQAMLTEYGGHESCPLQAKSSIFAGAWSPISSHATNTATPTYIHHPYAGGDSDGMFTRSWPLDPVSASLCLTGLPSTAMHYEIKPEPLIGSADCTTLETHTPLLSDNGNNASLVEIPCETATKAAKERQPAEEIKEVDASKWCSPFLSIVVSLCTRVDVRNWGKWSKILEETRAI